MKKLILSIAVLSLFAASCGNTENKTEGTEETTAASTEGTAPADETTASTTTPASDAPTFSNEEVNKGVSDYKALLNEYIAAVKAKDAAKVQSLTAKSQEFSKNMQAWVTKLKPEETQQFSEYMQKLTKEWTDAATQSVQ